MTKQQRTNLKLLGMLVEALKSIGDIIFVIWLIQAITQFVPDPTYPFIGLPGVLYLSLIYLIALAIHYQQERLRKKYEKQ